MIKHKGKEQTTFHNSEYLLEVRNLKKYFPIKSGFFQKTVGYVKAIDDISLQVRKGETLGIVGESGCGKSTAGRTFIRLYKPTAGQIVFKNQDLSLLTEKELNQQVRKHIQMIFRDPFASLNPRKTLKAILSEPMKAYKLYNRQTQEEKIVELLNRVGLNASFMNRYPHEFSGGQRQRISIARSIALNPELIIADEAVSSLDVSIQAQIINLMKDLQEELKLTYIFISHDLSVIKHISDRVVVMYLGKIMELAPKSNLFKKPLHPYTKALLSAVPVLRKQGVKKRERIVLKGEIPSAITPPTGCVFHTRCPLVMDICQQKSPIFQEIASEHYVACHLYELDKRTNKQPYPTMKINVRRGK